MKAMPSVKFNFFSGLVLGTALLLCCVPTVLAQENAPAADDVSTRLTAIEKKLADSEIREKQILENQDKIFAELQKIRVLVRRS